jgi:hypothetical protein
MFGAACWPGVNREKLKRAFAVSMVFIDGSYSGPAPVVIRLAGR